VIRQLGAFLICALVLAACEKGPPQQVVVYVPTNYEERANSWLPESGLAVTVIVGNSATNTDRVIGKQDSPRADVLITSNAIDIWRAADVGALRPIQGEALARVPSQLKDPDGSWAALGYRRVVIGVASDADRLLVSGFRDLGAQGLAGKLCLSSFALPANRALVGILIEDLGIKPAERLVRSWVRNLAAAPFASEAELQAALERGDCDFGVVSELPDGSSISTVLPRPTYLQIDGVGISRHAVNADAAQRLVDWMLSDYQPDELNESVVHNAGVAGWRDEEARLLAERAGYR